MRPRYTLVFGALASGLTLGTVGGSCWMHGNGSPGNESMRLGASLTRPAASLAEWVQMAVHHGDLSARMMALQRIAELDAGGLYFLEALRSAAQDEACVRQAACIAASRRKDLAPQEASVLWDLLECDDGLTRLEAARALLGHGLSGPRLESALTDLRGVVLEYLALKLACAHSARKAQAVIAVRILESHGSDLLALPAMEALRTSGRDGAYALPLLMRIARDPGHSAEARAHALRVVAALDRAMDEQEGD